MRWAVIGMGLIGKKRAAALGDRCVATCDIDGNYRETVRRSDVDAVCVATPHNLLATIACKAIHHGKHVLIEKPGATDPYYLKVTADYAIDRGVKVAVGYNLRYHPAIAKARELVDAGFIGPLMYVHGFYGHGARVGYDQEWRMQKKYAGRGSVIDQGSHLVDLAAWFLGGFATVTGHTSRSFWTAADVDDNAFLSLRTATGQTAWLRASCSEWKNRFLFEIYGTTGKLVIEGLGGSYGLERLTWYRMKPEMGPPEVAAYNFGGADVSWRTEIAAFEAASLPECHARLEDAVKVLTTINQIPPPQ